MLFAAGGVAIERWTERASVGHGARRVAGIDAARRGARGSPGRASLPVDAYVRYANAAGIQPAPSERHQVGALPQFFADMFGWHELVEEVGTRRPHAAPRRPRQGGRS